MDPIADMFAKIKNAQAVKKETVAVPYSKLKMEIAKLLLKNNYIKEINRRGKKNKKSIEVSLIYNNLGKGIINNISRVSKVSRRVYLPFKEIKPVKRGIGIIIVSTSKGLLTDKEAAREKVGGEVLAKLW